MVPTPVVLGLRPARADPSPVSCSACGLRAPREGTATAAAPASAGRWPLGSELASLAAACRRR